MSKKEIEFFMDGLEKLIDYHAAENKLTIAELIGCLEIKKQEIISDLYDS